VDVDISVWLRDLGLGRYEQAFREHEIDLDLLPTLTAEDLKDLGVGVVGHRRKLLNAIAALRKAEPSQDVVAPLPKAAAPAARDPGEAERRQLTVLFCDLVASTELAARLDPEDMGALIRAFQDCCAEVIRRWEGYVAKYTGDGLSVYFGYPKAYEDGAERAVRAGLELTEVVGRLITPTAERLRVRIGIATGLVVVGDLIGEDTAQERAVAGETPHLAARLQALAAPGTVVIAPNTRRLLGSLFDLADLGTHRLKGFAEPIRAWQVLGESQAEGRFAAMHEAELTPLIGREEELQLLLSRWQRAKEGDGQVVLLSGEAGIGKSRIAQALWARVADEPCKRLRYYCSPYHINSALHPVIEQLERAAGLQRSDSPARKLDKLEATLVQDGAAAAAVALLAPFLSIPTGARYPPVELSPKQQKEKTFQLLIDQLKGLAARQPVLILFEDAHWIDPSTQELLHLLVPQMQPLPILLVITFRPEFTPPWTGHTHVTQLSLSRLSQRQATVLIEGLTAGRSLPPNVLAQILVKTDGVPLFVEELTKTVLESGLLEDRGDRHELTGPLPPLAIPSTLQDSLMARLDRLAPVKEVAQIGAVIGREFSYRLLAALSPLDETALQEALSHLVSSELVFRRGTIPDATYSFKHAFVQDAAYASLLRSRRQQLHAEVTSVLQERFPDLADSQPEILAHHLTEAGLTDAAIDCWQKAGQLAAERSANPEAAAHFERSLELLKALPENAERDHRELDLLTALGSTLLITKGHTSPAAGGLYQRARDLCRSVGATPHLAPVLQGLRLHHMWRAELEPARRAAEELLELANKTQRTGDRLEAHRAVGVVDFYAGELLAARKHLEKGIELYDPQEHGTHALRYEHDPGQTCLSHAARVLWMLGYPDQAVERAEQAIEVAKATSHAASVAEALDWRAEVSLLRREAWETQERAAAALALGAEHGLRDWTAIAAVMHGWALSEQGQHVAGAAQAREGMLKLAETGERLFHDRFLAVFAQVLRASGQVKDGLAALDQALASALETGFNQWNAELQRLKGELIVARKELDKAAVEACFREAIETAQRQEAKSLELRAATSLARLWAEQRRRAEAHDLLAPVYGWFTEGFEIQDLKDARALLDELA
jgi:predicted ATPase/class 3 adenylate cyclase